MELKRIEKNVNVIKCNFRMATQGGLARGRVELANLATYTRRYTKYIQNIHNLNKIAA